MDNCFTLIYRTMSTLSNKKIAILSESGFEESELTSPKAALEEAGATVHIISPQKDSIKSWDKDNWGIELKVDKAVSEASVERSEEHTSELQSRENLVCRLLLEKKKDKQIATGIVTA